MGAEEQRMRQFFMERVRQDPLLDGQNYIYMHYADMIANGYHRLTPCPFQTQGVMLNPNGDLFFCENSDVVGNVTREDPEAIYFRETRRRTASVIRDEKCPSCLSPCQMNVAAIKQVVPYAKFLVRASMEKRRPSPDAPAAPPPAAAAAQSTTALTDPAPRPRVGAPIFLRVNMPAGTISARVSRCAPSAAARSSSVVPRSC